MWKCEWGGVKMVGMSEMRWNGNEKKKKWKIEQAKNLRNAGNKEEKLKKWI